MARTESKTHKVHPDYEQSTIDLMQRFHWNLASSQDVKTQTAHVERDGDDLVQVKQTEHFVSLVFSRDLDTPNLPRLRELENEFFSIKYPGKPGLKAPIITASVFGFMAFGAFDGKSIGGGLAMLALGACCYPWLQPNQRKGKEADELTTKLDQRKQAILAESDRL